MLILTRFLTLGAILIAGSALIALFGIAGLPHWIESWFRTRSAWIPRLLWIAVGVFVVYFGLFAIFRHYNLGTTTLDMGNVEQAVWNTAHGAPFRMTTDPEYGYPLAPRTGDLPATRLAFHVEPIIVSLALVYRFLPWTETLLLLQVIALALGAILVAKTAERLGAGPLAGLLFALVYLLAEPVQNAATYEVHPVAFGLPAFLLTFWLLVKRRYGWMVIASLGLMASREDAALLALAFGVFLLFRRDAQRYGIIITALALLWLGAVAAIIGHFHQGSYEYSVRSGLTSVQGILALLTDPYRWYYLLWLLVPLAFLPLAYPALAACALIPVGIVLATGKHYELLGWLHYHVLGYGPLIAAAVGGSVRVAARFRARVHPLLPALAAFVLALGLSLVNGRYLPFSLPDWEQRRTVREAASLIPDTASVAASWNLGPWVSRRPTLFILTSPQADTADVIFVRDCATTTCDNFPQKEYAAILQRVARDPARRLVFDRDGIRLYTRLTP